MLICRGPSTEPSAVAPGQTLFSGVFVLCGGFPEQSLKDAGCIAIYKDPADLLARYEESPIVKT